VNYGYLPCTRGPPTRNLVLPSFTVPFNNVVSRLHSTWLRVVAPHSSENQGLVFQGSEAYVLIPILKVVVQASAAFTPLQSAAGGLLGVMKIVEVRLRSSL